MNTAGALALWFAVLMAVWAAPVSMAGAVRRHGEMVRSGELAVMVMAVASLVAIGALLAALQAADFSLRYVAVHTSSLLPRRYALLSLWAGQAGTLLTFGGAASVAAAVAVWRHRTRVPALMPFVTAVLALVAGLFLAVAAWGAPPFATLQPVPEDGRGLQPLLLHPGMAAYPPLVIAGLAVLVVPGAFAVGSAMARTQDATWVDTARRWTLVGWGLLTAGLGAGLWWAHSQLGWFGYLWTWEPYASAPLLAWLFASALLLVATVERPGSRRDDLTLALGAVTLLLVLFAAVRMRLGISGSVRAVAAYPQPFTLIVGAMAIVLLALLAFVPLRKAADGGWEPRQRLGALILLLGVASTIGGAVAGQFGRSITAPIAIGEAITATDPLGRSWRFVSQGISKYQEPDHTVLGAVIAATRGGQRVGLLTSSERQYYDARGDEAFEATTTADLLSTPLMDVSFAFLDALDRDTASVRITFIPLAWALWAGLVLLTLGAALVAWPSGTPDEALE